MLARIDSPHNPQLKTLNRLLEKAKARQTEQRCVLEGLHLCHTLLDRGGRLERLYLNSRAEHHPEVQALLQRCATTTECVWVAEAALQKMSALHSAPEVLGVMSLAVLPHPMVMSQDKLLLESIRDPGNLGTLLRTAAAAGISQVYLSPDCVDAWSSKVLRAAMGAHFSLQIVSDADLARVLADFSGTKLVTHLAAEHSLYQCDLTSPCAFVFGNEGTGVSDALAALAQPVLIPMPGQTESLNVAIAAAVCLFEQVRQRAAVLV